MDDEKEQPQLYLITPGEMDLDTYPDLLARSLDSVEIACVRLSLGTRDEGKIARAADALREITHRRDIALVIENHVMLVEKLGLDGVHLTDGARSVKKVRADLGLDAIVGAYCRASRHDGMTAGELGADYVSFGPVGATAIGDGTLAEKDLFEWWSMMIEVPVVAEGALDENLVRSLSPFTDFFGIGDEIWSQEDPVKSLQALYSAMAEA